MSKTKKPKSLLKQRKNFTLSPTAIDCLKQLAEEDDASMSAMLNRLIREKWDEKQHAKPRHHP